MNREIKFRLFGKGSKEFLRDDISNSFSLRELQNVVLISDDWEVSQFTGLKDKNGKEIYEGDILLEAPDRVYEVKWVDCGWRCVGGGYSFYLYSEDAYDIVGNIYENPELLK